MNGFSSSPYSLFLIRSTKPLNYQIDKLRKHIEEKEFIHRNVSFMILAGFMLNAALLILEEVCKSKPPIVYLIMFRLCRGESSSSSEERYEEKEAQSKRLGFSPGEPQSEDEQANQESR